MTSRSAILLGIATGLIGVLVAQQTTSGIHVYHGIAIGVALTTLAFGFLLKRSHKTFDEQAKMTDQALDLLRQTIDQRDKAVANAHRAIELNNIWEARYKMLSEELERRNDEGEDWKDQ